MHRLRSLLPLLLAAACGAATMATIAYAWLPRTVVVLAFAAFFVLVLPRRPALVAAYCAGAFATVVLAFVSLLNPAWDRCADEVDGELVEFRCSDGAPPGRDSSAG